MRYFYKSKILEKSLKLIKISIIQYLFLSDNRQKRTKTKKKHPSKLFLKKVLNPIKYARELQHSEIPLLIPLDSQFSALSHLGFTNELPRETFLYFYLHDCDDHFQAILESQAETQDLVMNWLEVEIMHVCNNSHFGSELTEALEVLIGLSLLLGKGFAGYISF